MGLVYMYRNRYTGVEYSDLNDNWKIWRQRQWMQAYQFDLNRMEFLEHKLAAINEEIHKTEIQRFD